MLPGVRRTYAAIAEQGKVPLCTLHHRAQGRPSIEEKAQSQQYLTPDEERAVVKFVLLMSDLGKPVRIKSIPSLAFCVACRRLTGRSNKPPSKNWADTQVKARKVGAIDWKRHGSHTRGKIVP